ncbi:MAG: hypothetical protein V4658_13320 [Bacteroidota bacterium]
MNNIENIPAPVFDWLRTTPFEKLDAAQQKTVEAFMSITAYNEMHDATQLLSETKYNPFSRQEEIRHNLLQQFERKHNQPQQPKLFYSSQLVWKIAAVFLAVGLPISAYFLIKSNKKLITNQLNGRVDTVYLENTATSNPLKVYDTVYIVKERNSPRTTIHKEQEVTKNPIDEVNVGLQHDISIQSIKNVDSAPNKRRRNSIKDDSLINHYNFVTL